VGQKSEIILRNDPDELMSEVFLFIDFIFLNIIYLKEIEERTE